MLYKNVKVVTTTKGDSKVRPTPKKPRDMK